MAHNQLEMRLTDYYSPIFFSAITTLGNRLGWETNMYPKSSSEILWLSGLDPGLPGVSPTHLTLYYFPSPLPMKIASFNKLWIKYIFTSIRSNPSNLKKLRYGGQRWASFNPRTVFIGSNLNNSASSFIGFQKFNGEMRNTFQTLLKVLAALLFVRDSRHWSAKKCSRVQVSWRVRFKSKVNYGCSQSNFHQSLPQSVIMRIKWEEGISLRERDSLEMGNINKYLNRNVYCFEFLGEILQQTNNKLWELVMANFFKNAFVVPKRCVYELAASMFPVWKMGQSFHEHFQRAWFCH